MEKVIAFLRSAANTLKSRRIISVILIISALLARWLGYNEITENQTQVLINALIDTFNGVADLLAAILTTWSFIKPKQK